MPINYGFVSTKIVQILPRTAIQQPILFLLKPLVMFLAVLSLSCAHDEVALNYGIQLAHRSFVPARIAVLGCQTWPNGARYQNQPLSNADPAEVARLCDKVNQFVIGGFSGQSFMRGLTPKAVGKALDTAGKKSLLSKIDELWRHLPEDCAACEDPVTFYVKSIAGRADWQDYLVRLAAAVGQVDALLLPMVTYVVEFQTADRGITERTRQAGLVMLLFDTGSGQLIWSGGRQAQAVKRAVTTGRIPQEAEYPPWDLVHERLFQEDVWREFPGRQML